MLIADRLKEGTPLEEIEQLLKTGQLAGEIHGRNRVVWWRVRRNGQTKRWKTDPKRFRIPVKAGLSEYGYIEPNNLQFFGVITGETR